MFVNDDSFLNNNEWHKNTKSIFIEGNSDEAELL